MVAAVLSDPLWHKIYLRLVKKQEQETGEEGASEPEFRLPPAVGGAPLVTIGVFWFAWTLYPSIHWIVPIMASAVFGAGSVLGTPLMRRATRLTMSTERSSCFRACSRSWSRLIPRTPPAHWRPTLSRVARLPRRFHSLDSKVSCYQPRGTAHAVFLVLPLGRLRCHVPMTAADGSSQCITSWATNGLPRFSASLHSPWRPFRELNVYSLNSVAH